jgi:hypothetical protein
MIPELTQNGVLPPGLHEATLGEVRRRFGAANKRRVELMKGLSTIVARARQAGGLRIYLDGSFVTMKKEPLDWDAVLVVPEGFDPTTEEGVALGDRDAVRTLHEGDLLVFFEDDKEAIEHYVGRVFAHDREHRKKGVIVIRLKGEKGLHGAH